MMQVLESYHMDEGEIGGLALSLVIGQEKKCKKIQGWHAKKYANKVGMMHESKGQRIGKAPSLHLFHTTVRQHP